jgi:hypothetical protein
MYPVSVHRLPTCNVRKYISCLLHVRKLIQRLAARVECIIQLPRLLSESWATVPLSAADFGVQALTNFSVYNLLTVVSCDV